MDEKKIITAAHHEAGHALMAHILGWKMNSIELEIENGVLKYGVTKYDFGNDEMTNFFNIKRRVYCLIGGPIAQAIFENNDQINLDDLGHDGISIDNFLSTFDKQTKENIIQEAINTTATFLKIPSSIIARQCIVEKLITNYNISQTEFIEIVTKSDVVKIDFNSKSNS